MIFKTLISGYQQDRERRKARKAANREEERALQNAVERLVDEVNPRLRAVTGYRRKMSPAVATTLAFSKQVVGSLPSAVRVSKDTWNSTPAVRAFFSGIGDLQQVYSDSPVVRDYFDQHAGCDECYALLSMQRSERTVLGMEMQGEVMKRDVKQVSVSFSDHRVVRIADTETALRKELEDRAFEVTVAYLLEELNELIASRDSLEQQKQLLDIQSRLSRAKQASLVPLFENGAGDTDDITLHEQQRRTDAALHQARAKLTTLDDYIDRIADVLGHPQEHLLVNRISMRLNKMNIKMDDDAVDSGAVLDLTEVSIGKLRRVILITRYPRSELLAKKDFLEEAERRLH